MGGMLVLGITYMVWGFIAPRFSRVRPHAARAPARRLTSRRPQLPPSSVRVAAPAAAETVERMKATGRINLGYIVDARPFTFPAAPAPPRATASVVPARRRADENAARGAATGRAVGAGYCRQPDTRSPARRRGPTLHAHERDLGATAGRGILDCPSSRAAPAPSCDADAPQYRSATRSPRARPPPRVARLPGR